MTDEPATNRQTTTDDDFAIIEVVCVPLVGESPEGGWYTEIKPEDSVHGIIAVHTQGGISGYGSVFTDGFLAAEAVRLLTPHLIGCDARNVAQLTETLHQNTFWMGRGGTLTHVIGGIDIALWDILGKATGLPISTLLGGRYQEKVRPYASMLMTGPEDMAERIKPYKAQGYRAVKIGWGPFGRSDSYKLDEAIIAAARDVLDDGEALMVDPGASDAFWPNGRAWARRTADMLAAYDVAWFEEALPPDDIEGHVDLRRISRVPIAGGEVLTRRQSFVPYLKAGAFDIVQPDVTKVGGLSEQRQIVEMARAMGTDYVGHGWNTALGLAADLQMAAGLPGVRFVEHIVGSRYVDGILSEPFEMDRNGFIAIPSSPGLGITLDPDRLEPVTHGLDALRLS